MWCIIGSDQPSNWEVNVFLSASLLSIRKLRNHQQTLFISPMKCANFDQGHFSIPSAFQLYRISSTSHRDARISGGLVLYSSCKSQPSERLQGLCWCCNVCNNQGCPETICSSLLKLGLKRGFPNTVPAKHRWLLPQQLQTGTPQSLYIFNSGQGHQINKTFIFVDQCALSI